MLKKILVTGAGGFIGGFIVEEAFGEVMKLGPVFVPLPIKNI